MTASRALSLALVLVTTAGAAAACGEDSLSGRAGPADGGVAADGKPADGGPGARDDAAFAGDVPTPAPDAGGPAPMDVASLDAGDEQTDLGAGDATDGGAEADGGAESDGGPEADGGLEVDGGGPVQDCLEPVSFDPPGLPQPWRHAATRLLTVSQGAPNHRGQDVLAVAEGPQVLVGKFAYGVFDKDLKDEDVEVYLQRQAPCGRWESEGVWETSEDGEYGDRFGVADDGGRVFLELPPARLRPVGWHPVRMLVLGDHSTAAFRLGVLHPGTEAVVFDIDGTLTTADFELIRELFDDLLRGDYVPEMYPAAPDVVWTWQQRGYLVIYLTGRPDLLRGISEAWLRELGFPAGAVHLTDTNQQALPTEAGVARYKAEFLQRLQTELGLELVAAYGNASTDISAYEQAGVPKERTFIIGSNAGHEGTVAVEDYGSHLLELQDLPEAAAPAPEPMGWW